jgi:hypothetical protein
MNRIRTAIGATTINPELLTYAEKLRYQGYLRRQDSHAAIAALVSDGVPFKESHTIAQAGMQLVLRG